MEGGLLWTKWLTKASSDWWHFTGALRIEKAPDKENNAKNLFFNDELKRMSILKLSEARAKCTRKDVR